MGRRSGPGWPSYGCASRAGVGGTRWGGSFWAGVISRGRQLLERALPLVRRALPHLLLPRVLSSLGVAYGELVARTTRRRCSRAPWPRRGRCRPPDGHADLHPHPCRRCVSRSRPSGGRPRRGRGGPPAARAHGGTGATKAGFCTPLGSCRRACRGRGARRGRIRPGRRSPRRSRCVRSRRAAVWGSPRSTTGRAGRPSRARGILDGAIASLRATGMNLLARAGGGAPGRPPLTGPPIGVAELSGRRAPRFTRDLVGSCSAIHAGHACRASHGRPRARWPPRRRRRRTPRETDLGRRPPVDLRLGFGHALRRRDDRVEQVVESERAGGRRLRSAFDRIAVRYAGRELPGQRDVGP